MEQLTELCTWCGQPVGAHGDGLGQISLRSCARLAVRLGRQRCQSSISGPHGPRCTNIASYRWVRLSEPSGVYLPPRPVDPVLCQVHCAEWREGVASLEGTAAAYTYKVETL